MLSDRASYLKLHKIFISRMAYTAEIMFLSTTRERLNNVIAMIIRKVANDHHKCSNERPGRLLNFLVFTGVFITKYGKNKYFQVTKIPHVEPQTHKRPRLL